MRPGRGIDYPVVALYVPGDRPDRFDKAAAAGADVVILDLEDAVAEPAKASAREHVSSWTSRPPEVGLQVRINSRGSESFSADLEMITKLPAHIGIRLPKVETVDVLDEIAARCAGRAIHCLIETARGVQNLGRIADHPAVTSVALGEADLAADLRSRDSRLLDVIRGQLIVAAAAAGLPAPLMAAYPDIADLTGLQNTCSAGRDFGFGGRTAIHPKQVPVIRAAFAPDRESVDWARDVLAVLDGRGAAVLASGEMVDAAMARRARRILERH